MKDLILARSSLRAAVALACAALALALTWSAHEAIGGVDHRLFDVRTRIAGARAPSAGVMMIGVDPGSVERLGRPASHYDPLYARAIRAVTRAGATGIGLDVLEPHLYEILEDENADLGEAIAFAESNGVPVVLAAQALESRRGATGEVWQKIEFPAPFPGHATGLTNLTSDADGVVRRQKLFFASSDGKNFPGFALALLSRVHHEDPASLAARVPQSREGGMFVSWAGPAGTWPMLPLADLLALEAGGETAAIAARVAGKIVLLGNWQLAGDDTHVTPWTIPGDPARPPMAGLEIHANALGTLLDGDFRRPGPTIWSLLWIGVLALGIPVAATNSSRAGLAALVAGVLASGAVSYVAFGSGTVVPFAAPALTAALGFTLATAARVVILARREREIRSLFGTFVSPVVLARLLESEGRDRAALERGEERVVTVMFTDIRGFTKQSEKSEPSEVLRWLRRYLTAMTEVVLAEGGTVDKFVGDGMVCLFGAPLSAEKDGALDATRCALAMVRRLDSLNAEFATEGLPRTKVGIGIHTGKVIVGVFGADQKREYTALGDTVNVAARIEGETKQVLEAPTNPGGNPLNGCVVMSEDCVARLRGTGLESRIHPQPVGDVTIRGRTATVKLYLVREA